MVWPDAGRCPQHHHRPRGGARGWAHIGVVRALQEAGIRIDFISGASIGALVGAIYCAEELDELEDFIRDLSWRDMLLYFDMVFPTSGLLDGNKVYELLSEHMQGMKIEESPIPFCCVATDLIKGEEVHLKSGSMVDAVRASISGHSALNSGNLPPALSCISCVSWSKKTTG